MDFGSAIKRPFLDMKTLIIGIVISLIPIVNFMTAGFGIKNAQKTFNNDNSLADWSDPVDLFVKGLILLVINIVYLIPALIVGAFAAASMFTTLISELGSVEALSDQAIIQSKLVEIIPKMLASGGVLLLVALLLGVIAAFLLPMAIMFFAKENRFGAAFKFGAIIKSALTGSYIIALIIAMVYSAILSAVVVAIFAFIPLVGPMLGAGILMYILAVTTYTIFAQALNELQGTKPKPAPQVAAK